MEKVKLEERKRSEGKIEKVTEKVYRKLVVVGDGGCGKTSLLTAFTRKQFSDVYEPTVFENYVTSIVINNNKEVELALWDTAGQEDYDRLRPLSYPGANVILICFSIDDRNSLINVGEKWCPEVTHYCPNTPIVLVGCKEDLRFDARVLKNLASLAIPERTVSCDEGAAMAARINATIYLECSSKTGGGVETVLTEAAEIAAAQSIKKKHKNSCYLF